MTEIKLIKNSEVEIAGEISAGDFMFGKEMAVKELSQTINIKGFRKGKIPEDLMLKNINQQALLERMAVIALEKKYPEIIKENKIKPIGRPEIVITKMAENNPLGFKIKTAVMPEVKLSNYKDVAKEATSEKKENISVNEAEVDKVLEDIIKSRAKKDDNGNEILPELNDEFARSLGNFEGLNALKKVVKENIIAEKEMKEKERVRLNILNKIIKSTSWEIPEILIEWEENKMLREMAGNITSMGLKWEDYLKHIKKTEEELKMSWREDALRRVKYGLALNEMAEKEKIEVSDDELNKEMEKISRHRAGAGGNTDKEHIRAHIYGILRNEKLFQLLENII